MAMVDVPRATAGRAPAAAALAKRRAFLHKNMCFRGSDQPHHATARGLDVPRRRTSTSKISVPCVRIGISQRAKARTNVPSS